MWSTVCAVVCIVELGYFSFYTFKNLNAEPPAALLLSSLLQFWSIFGYCYGLSSYFGISPVVLAACFLSFCLLENKKTQAVTGWIFRKMSWWSNFCAEFILDDLYELFATKLLQVLIPFEQKIFSLSLGSMSTSLNITDKNYLKVYLEKISAVAKNEKQSRGNNAKLRRVSGLYAGAAEHAAATSDLSDFPEHDVSSLHQQKTETLFTLEQLKMFYRKYIPQKITHVDEFYKEYAGRHAELSYKLQGLYGHRPADM